MELLVRKQEEHQEQIAQMINMMAMIVKIEGITTNLISQEGHVPKDSKENPLYPSEFIPPHANASYGQW